MSEFLEQKFSGEDMEMKSNSKRECLAAAGRCGGLSLEGRRNRRPELWCAGMGRWLRQPRV